MDSLSVLRQWNNTLIIIIINVIFNTIILNLSLQVISFHYLDNHDDAFPCFQTSVSVLVLIYPV